MFGWMPQPSRADFLIDPDLVFLNHGSFGAVPRTVLETYQSLQREMERNPVEWLGRRADDLMADARARLGSFVGATADDVVFVPNPTTAVNMVVRNLALREGDEVLTTDHEYGAMDRTWGRHVSATGARMVRVPVPLPVTTSDDFVDRVWGSVSPRTRVLFLSHLTSATALIFPVQELAERAHQRGIFVIIDGAHVPGHLPLDLRTLPCDIYTGALHKWLCAPKGCSFVYARREVQALLGPLVTSWGWESDHPGTSRFVDWHEWQGTRDLSPFLAFGAALDFALSHDLEGVQRRCRALALEARRRVDQLTGLGPISPFDDADARHRWIGQMTAIRLPHDTDVVALKQRLFDNFRIEVPVHRWSGQPLVRVSCAAHTTESDVDRLVDALRVLLPSTRVADA